MKLTESYKDNLIERLKKDHRLAVAYLNECLKDPDEAAFLMALRHVAEAYGFKRLAERTHISREHLFRMLSPMGNPRFENLRTVTAALGFGIEVTEKSQTRKAA